MTRFRDETPPDRHIDQAGHCGNCRHPYYLHRGPRGRDESLGECWHRDPDRDGRICDCDSWRLETDDEGAERRAALQALVEEARSLPDVETGPPAEQQSML